MRDPYFHVYQYQLGIARHWFRVSGAFTLHPKGWFQKLLVWYLTRKEVFHSYDDYSTTITQLDLPKEKLIFQIMRAINSIRANECLPHYEPKLVLMDYATSDELFGDENIRQYLAFVSNDLEIRDNYGIKGDYKLMNDVMIKVVPWIKGWCVL